MADWVRTYVDKIDTILKDDFNTELASIDATLTTVPNAQIFKSYQPFTQKHPLIQQYLIGDSIFDDLMSHESTILWNHYTGVRIVDTQPSTSQGNEVYAYVEALLKAIYKGDGNAAHLDGTVCYTKPVSWVVSNEVDDNFIVKEGGILWEIDHKYDLTE